MSGSDAEAMTAALVLARQSLDRGEIPVGAVVLDAAGEVIASAHNERESAHDPTAHAEVVAIRTACRATGDFSLPGAVLYASCEPCPLCLAAALWARVDRVVYAADRFDAARGGFDDLEFYRLFGTDRAQWPTEVAALPLTGCTRPFQAWLAKTDRVAY